MTVLEANDNARGILYCISKKQGLTEGKRCNYLNAFVKLVTKSEVGGGGLEEELQKKDCIWRRAKY